MFKQNFELLLIVDFFTCFTLNFAAETQLTLSESTRSTQSTQYNMAWVQLFSSLHVPNFNVAQNNYPMRKTYIWEMSYSTNNLKKKNFNEFFFTEKLTKLFKLFFKCKGLSYIWFLPTGKKDYLNTFANETSAFNTVDYSSKTIHRLYSFL